MPERFLVTGALGCLGAWTCRTLVDEGAEVVAFDLGDSRHRLELVMAPDALARLTFVRGDVTDLDGIGRTLAEHEITHVVHLAAMQIPFAAADPPRSAGVNVAGTVNLFAAVGRRELGGLAYASSSAVYSAADSDGADPVPEDADGHPVTHYGVHKQANEGAARVFWQDAGVASVGLRPYVVYGPGRDQGMTSATTQAMLAAARGQSHHIAFGGRAQHHYAPEVAGAFIAAAREAVDGDGASVRNLGGPASHMREVVAAIEAAAPEAAGQITYDAGTLLPVPDAFAAARPLSTPLEEGVRATVEHFRGTVG